MVYFVMSRMATCCMSVLLGRELCITRPKRHNELRSSGGENLLSMVGSTHAHRSCSTFVVRAGRCGFTRKPIQVGDREKFLYDCIRCPLFHGTEGTLGRRRRSVNDKSHGNGVIVADDDVDDHRKALERFFGEKSEICWQDEEVENEMPSEPRLPTVTMVSWEQHLLEEKEEDKVEETGNQWWRKLNLSFQMTPHSRGIILLNLLTFLYGSNISVVKNAGAEMDPTLFSLGRFAIASLAFAPFLSTAISSRKLVNISAELGLWASMGYLTQCIAVLTSDAARVSFISTFTVIVVPLLAGLSGTKITKITWCSAFAALVGVAFLESTGSPFAIGDVWSFVSAIMFGVHILRTEQLSNDLLPEDTLPVLSLQMIVITVCSGIWFLVSHLSSGDLSIRNIHSVNWPQLMHDAAAIPWLAMLYTGFLTTAFCLWCELVSLRDVKATEAAVIYTLEPLWGAALAWILMGERWGPNGWVGATFILSGCLTMQVFGHPESPAKEEAISDFNRTTADEGKRRDIELTTSKRR